jgi:hypothetical protein
MRMVLICGNKNRTADCKLFLLEKGSMSVGVDSAEYGGVL